MTSDETKPERPSTPIPSTMEGMGEASDELDMAPTTDEKEPEATPDDDETEDDSRTGQTFLRFKLDRLVEGAHDLIGNEIPTSDETVLINNTGRRIGICPKDGPPCDHLHDDGHLHGHLIIAPFGERQLKGGVVNRYDTEAWTIRNLVELRPPKHQREVQLERRRLASMVWLRLWTTAIFVLLGVEVTWLGSSPWYWLALAGVVLWMGTSFIQIPAARVWTSRIISFWVILGIGVGVPLAGDWLVGGGMDIFSEPPALLVGRLVQLVFVSIAAVLPALLYYLFDRQQLGTLRQSFYRSIIELEPKILTLEDAKSAYGSMVAEVYGSKAEADPHGRFTSSSRMPIIIATLALTSGWLLVLPPIEHPELSSLLVPTRSAVSYGFLGAYFFSIGMIVRRYTRSDLKPKTYGHVTVRLLLTMVLVWALSILPLWTDAAPGETSPYLLALSFMVGIVPNTGLMVIRQFLSSTLLKARVDSLHERLPLSHVDGLTLYEQARLAEEGIENISNLVYYNLVELVLQTRIPLHRLIDWVDQGILIMHVGDIKNLETLRNHGIRNASDLQAAITAARVRNGGKAGGAEEEALVGLIDADEPADLHRLRVIHDALQNDEWFTNIMLWRERSSMPGEHVFTLEEMFMPHRVLYARLGSAKPVSVVTAFATSTPTGDSAPSSTKDEAAEGEPAEDEAAEGEPAEDEAAGGEPAEDEPVNPASSPKEAAAPIPLESRPEPERSVG